MKNKPIVLQNIIKKKLNCKSDPSEYNKVELYQTMANSAFAKIHLDPTSLLQVNNNQYNVSIFEPPLEKVNKLQIGFKIFNKYNKWVYCRFKKKYNI